MLYHSIALVYLRLESELFNILSVLLQLAILNVMAISAMYILFFKSAKVVNNVDKIYCIPCFFDKGKCFGVLIKKNKVKKAQKTYFFVPTDVITPVIPPENIISDVNVFLSSDNTPDAVTENGNDTGVPPKSKLIFKFRCSIL